jgi:Tol biopolymer transport system component
MIGLWSAVPPERTYPIVLAQVPMDPDLERQPSRSGGMLRKPYGDGARIVRLDTNGRVTVLTEGFHSACEFDVSFDAKRIIFAGKRCEEDKWNIFEMEAGGSGVRPITRDLGNCRTPAYQSTLYTIVSKEPWYQIMFASDAAGTLNEFGSGPSMSLYSCRMDGTGVRRLTFNLSDDVDPYLMKDGRILLASWQRADLRHGSQGRVSLFGINSDGTDYALYTGDKGQRIKHMPCETTDGLVVFVEGAWVGWDGAGQLGAVKTKRSLYAYQSLMSANEYLYHSPSPLPDGSVLVSHRRSDGTGTHGVCRLKPETGEVELVQDDPGYHDMHARALVPRSKPDGRSSVVNEEYPTGKLYCLNAYVDKRRLMQHLKAGEIKQVRVIEGVPNRPSDDLAANGLTSIVQKRLLGVAPVETDGSFHIELPADVPVQLQTLDKDGLALRTCGWIWVKHHEPRGCIGCHEDPELTPENRFVEALKKPGEKLTPPPERRQTVDFRRDVMPIIERRCTATDCHGEPHTPPYMSSERAGRFNHAYVNLLEGVTETMAGGAGAVGRYVHAGSARNSRLIWRLFGRSTARPWDRHYQPDATMPLMPPGHALTDEEKRTFIEWIDLGALWDGIPADGQPATSTQEAP